MLEGPKKTYPRWQRNLVYFIHSNAFLLFLLLLLITFLPFIILGQDSYFTIHDNLDSELPMRVVLARSGAYFQTGGTIAQLMGAMPRASFPSALNITNILFLIFTPFTAYLINHLFVHTVAFIGMFVLLRSYCSSNGSLINAGISFTFALLPFYTIFSLSIAGQPLLLYAILNLLTRRKKLRSFFIFCIWPFCSSLAVVGVFVVASVLLLLVIDGVTRKKFNGFLCGALTAMSILYFVTEYTLIKSFAFSTFVSHRTEWNIDWFSQDFMTCLRKTVNNFFFGQYHAASLHLFIVTVALPLGIAGALIRKKRKFLIALLTLTGICAIFSLLNGFQQYDGLIPLKKSFPVLGYFQFGRFHWLHPVLWYFIMGVSIASFSRIRYGFLSKGRKIAYLLIVCQVVFVVSNNYEILGTLRIAANRILGPDARCISFAQFYSENLFKKIDLAIGKPKDSYRVISIGLHPAIAIYNGFYTSDFYMSNYPLKYKHLFRKIISKELSKNRRWQEYFDAWGSRCYVFAAEQNALSFPKTTEFKIKNLELNTEEFKKMGGNYIFSSVEIENYKDNHLIFKGAYEDAQSPWRIYLYELE